MLEKDAHKRVAPYMMAAMPYGKRMVSYLFLNLSD